MASTSPVPYYWERYRWRRLRAWWATRRGPGVVACAAIYTAHTAEGRKPVLCQLTVHDGDSEHYGVSGGFPVRWAVRP